MNGTTERRSQVDKFKELAGELEAEEDEARWDERLKKVAAHKSVKEKPE
jgi:RNase H-fold protein (predicted Holliday junction resolvase)